MSAAPGLRNHVSRLRRSLGPGAAARVRTLAPGYLVEVGEGELDEQEFRQGCLLGRKALQDGDFASASRILASALGLWRGEPLADLPHSTDAAVQLRRLQETRLLALEGRFEADLRLSRHRDLLPELRALAGAHPLREALHGQLMLALYRVGRPTEALEVFRALRRALVQEFGVEPSPSVQELHRRMLDGDATLAAPAPLDAAPAPEPSAGTGTTGTTGTTRAEGAGSRATPGSPRHQLPADTVAFTGRSRELDELLGLARQAPQDGEPGTVVISAIDGMGGIGKSTLAIHAAHRIRARFPDGQLFIDLHGHTPGSAPLGVGEALDWFLRSLGVPPQLIPQDLDERAAFYRDRLADTRTLIILDNAASTAQVRQLLPATPGCLVLVTSRRRLTGLDDAHTIALDVLSGAEAVALLHAVAGPGRIPPDHPGVLELVGLCGHMPLAIRITAAQLRRRPSLRVADVVRRLRDERDRLDHLQDEDLDLAAVFESSYLALPAAEQQLFRHLGQAPGPDIDACAAANLIGADHRTAERLLESLLDHNLLTQHALGRYRFHDLVRLYARTAGSTGHVAGSAAALERLLDYYQHTARTADLLLARVTRPGPAPAGAQAGAGAGPAPAVRPRLSDRAQALAWMRTERHNLLAATAHAAARAAALAWSRSPRRCPPSSRGRVPGPRPPPCTTPPPAPPTVSATGSARPTPSAISAGSATCPGLFPPRPPSVNGR
ncbi:hypothetical protein GXW82_09715 [Streptacidiphilus sp. 4-A2]|nr:hypothetical protein [Streptacidiphilus sp. 4-A2]